MHDNLIDAVNWVVEHGDADRDRVGISSLANFMRTLPATARPHLANNWHLFVGDPADPAQEADMLARSPITKVDQNRTPLMVVQGANDSRVVQAESHNLIDMYHAVERFFAEHLGGRPASISGA